jgi:hypothetical protein
MKKVLGLMFFACAMSIVACSPQELVYNLEPLELEGLEVDGVLRANVETGEFTLGFSVKNNSEEPFILAPYLIALTTEDNTMSPPTVFDVAEEIRVMPGSSAEVNLKYMPINNRVLYQRWELQGDFRKSYTVPLGKAILTPEYQSFTDAEIAFSASEKDYENYIKRYGIEDHMTVLGIDIDPQVFEPKQKQYIEEKGILEEHDHHHHDGEEECFMCSVEMEATVIVSGEEFVLHDRIIKIAPFIVKNDLYLFVRLQNRGEPVLVYSDKFVISDGENTYKPINDLSGIKPALSRENEELPDNQIVVLRNERARFNLVYKIKKPAQKYTVSMDGIIVNDDIRLFVEDISYIKSDM